MICLRILFFVSICVNSIVAQTKYNIVSNHPNELVFHISSKPQSVDDLSPIHFLIGLPSENLPNIQIQYGESRSHFYESVKPIETKWINNQMVNGLNTATLQISLTNQSGSYLKDQFITIRFTPREIENRPPTNRQKQLLSPKIINWKWAQQWMTNQKNTSNKINLIPEGYWIQLEVMEDGIVKISGEELAKYLPNNRNFDPRSIMVFSGTAFGRDRTFKLTQKAVSNTTIPENLIELPIFIQGELDGNMAENDILYFYAQGPSGFDQNVADIQWHQNLYFNKSLYWLLLPNDSFERGKRIETNNIVSDGPLSIDFGVEYLHYEKDSENPEKSGLGWGNTSIQKDGSFTQLVELSQPVLETVAIGSFGMIGHESVPTRYGNTKHKVSLQLNNIELGKLEWPHLGLRSTKFNIPARILTDGVKSFQLKNDSDNPNSAPYFDFLTLAYTRKLIYTSPFQFFSSVTDNNISFIIDGNNINVWNITSPSHPQNIPVKSNNNTTTIRVSLPADTLQRYFVFNLEDVPFFTDITSIGPRSWNTLRNTTSGADHIIIGPEEFTSSAQPLVNHRQKTLFASLENIYGEFSGGNKDPVAIRHFLNWTQLNWNKKPSTVLFIGDADYDYRNITGESQIKVPTIQVGTSYSHATDDRFVAFNGLIPEMATGRYPARSEEEVSTFVDKIIDFEKNMPKGLWKQRLTLVADDPARPEKEPYELFIGKSHTINSERLAKAIPNFMEVKKLYMVEYPEINDGSIFGVVKPEATQALMDQLFNGTALINYIGHGNPTQWAQEKLLVLNETRNDIDDIKTNMKLPIWLAGTCNWGHFDAIGRESFAEELIRKNMDGASAIITTTRGITVTSNIHYLESIFGEFFKGDSVSHLSLGMLLQSVKTGQSDGELFHLFGDPAMQLPIPKQLVRSTTVSPDTLATLDVGTLTGNTLFNSGEGYLVLEDGANEKTQLFQFSSKNETLTYLENGPTLFRGAFTFSNGSLSPQFRVPKDISYTKQKAKLRFNILDDKGNEAIGSISNIVLTLGIPSTDVEGPIITFETQDGRLLRSGDHIPTSENLTVRLSDPLGINLTGEKGHELWFIDPINEEKVNMVNRFIYDTNSLKTGTINFPIQTDLDALSIGVNAWDNANNPSEVYIDLFLLESNKLDLLNVLNFPNPFANETHFTFELTAIANVTIDIFTLEGRRIKSLFPEQFPMGYHRIKWDGRDDFGNRLANGVYFYKMTAKNDSQKVNHIGRLAIYR